MTRYDVVVLGEPMVERHGGADGRPAGPDSVSGDAFNAAVAAVLAGARVALLTVLGADPAGELILAELRRRGIDQAPVRRSGEPTGAYTVALNELGQPEFHYQRAGSAAATRLRLDRLADWGPILDDAPVLLTSGITAAISPNAAELVGAAIARTAAAGGTTCYDVNFRPRLTDATSARKALEALAPRCRLVKIASPGDSEPLFGRTDPAEVAAAVGELTDAAIVVTQGAAPVLLVEGGRATEHPALPLPTPVDSTGAGDVLLGTAVARLARGEPLATAVALGVAAAGLSTRHRGGAPRAALTEVRAAAGLELEEEARS